MCVGFGTEAEINAPRLFQYRTSDQGRVGKQQLRCGSCRDPIPGFRIQLPPGGPAPVDELFPAQFDQPGFHSRELQPLAAEIVEAMGDPLVVEPAPRLGDRIAVADAVNNRGAANNRGHARTHRQKRRPE